MIFGGSFYRKSSDATYRIRIGIFFLIVLLFSWTYLEAITRNVDQGNASCDDATGTPFCTVVAAINGSSNGDVIEIAAGSYIEQIVIDRNITLRGEGISATQGLCNGVTNLLGSPPITVLAGARATITGVTIKGGAFVPFGAGVTNAGELSMLNSEVCQNSTSQQGGGIYTSGPLILFGVQVYDNVQDFPEAEGGGLYVASGATAIVDYSSFTNNRVTIGGGIAVAFGGILLMKNSTVESNFADDSVVNTVEGVGGGIKNSGLAIIDQTQIGYNALLNANGLGGGIYNDGGLLLTRSSIISNVIDYTLVDLIGPAFGGGLYNSGIASLISTTVSGNILQPNLLAYGAGIATSGTLNLSNVTITENSNGGAALTSGAGIYESGGSVTIRNSIVALQTVGDDCFGTITTDGYNVDSDGTCDLVDVASGGTDQPLIANPGLLPLSQNGGPTRSHNLAEDSPAIDAGNPAGCLGDLNGIGTPNVSLVTDQRGNIFVDVANVVGICDVGAVEYNLLSNGMMEDDDELDGLPDDWTGVNLLKPDKLLIKPRKAHTGIRYFKLKGRSSTTKQLVQTMERSGGNGDQYTLRLFVRGNNVTGTPVARLQLDDLQSVGIDEEFVLPLTTGTYGYIEHTLDVTSSINDYDQVTVIAEDGDGGKLGIDDVSLVNHP